MVGKCLQNTGTTFIAIWDENTQAVFMVVSFALLWNQWNLKGYETNGYTTKLEWIFPIEWKFCFSTANWGELTLVWLTPLRHFVVVPCKQIQTHKWTSMKVTRYYVNSAFNEIFTVSLPTPRHLLLKFTRLSSVLWSAKIQAHVRVQAYVQSECPSQSHYFSMTIAAIVEHCVFTVYLKLTQSVVLNASNKYSVVSKLPKILKCLTKFNYFKSKCIDQ